MNSLKLSALGFLLSATTFAYAAEYCPEEVIVENGEYTAPEDFYITRYEIEDEDTSIPALKLPFYTAAYNMVDGKTNTITCFFTENSSSIEIGTLQTHLPQPVLEGTKWHDYDTDYFTCGFMELEITPEDCPWEWYYK